MYLTLTCRASANGSHTYSLPEFNIAWHFLMGESGTPRSWRNLNLRVLQSDDTVHSLMREGLWCKVYDARVQHSAKYAALAVHACQVTVRVLAATYRSAR